MTLFDEADLSATLPPENLVRARLTIAYDGSAFHGFAPNPGVATVGGTLREVLEKVLRYPVELTCAGRTDTGVHAWGQVVSFDAPIDRYDPPALQRSLNRLCGLTQTTRPLPLPTMPLLTGSQVCCRLIFGTLNL
jgi:tRNA pseudouridine38-40 synthase